jgi:hypothetical protein
MLAKCNKKCLEEYDLEECGQLRFDISEKPHRKTFRKLYKPFWED